MKGSKYILRLFGMVAFGCIVMGLGVPRLLAQTEDSKEISALLVEARSHAMLAADDAATLQSYAFSSTSWQTHGARLAQMTDHVNELGQINQQLSDLRSQGSPWQQTAIDRIDPLLRDMAAQLTATLRHLKQNPNKVQMPPYRDYVSANYDYARRTAEMIADFVEYDNARATVRRLEQKLELPKSTGEGE